MSLEERIRRFAEQARAYLLEEFAKSLQEDTTIVQWQGFDQDGKLVVKNKDLLSTVDGVGQKYTTKGSDLILDNIGSVEQKKSRRKEELILEKKLIPIPAQPFVPRSAIIIFPEFEGEVVIVGDFVLAYGYLRLDAGVSNNYAEMWGSVGNGVGADSALLVNVTNAYSAKNTYYFGGGGAYCFTQGFVIPGTTYTSSVELSGTPWDFSISASANGFTQDSDSYATTAFGVLNNNIFATIDYDIQGAYGGGIGQYEVDFSYFTPPETVFYFQHGNLGPDASDPIHKELNLQDYFTDTIVAYELLHNYTKKRAIENDSTSSQTFLIFYVQTVDFTYNQVFNTAPSGYDGSQWEGRLVGALKHWYLHIKIDHDNNNVYQKTKRQTKMASGTNYTTSITEFDDGYQGDNVFAVIETYKSNTAGSRYRVRVDIDYYNSLTWRVRYPHLQDILSEAYEGDWLYEWRNVIIPDSSDPNYPSGFFDRFYYKFLRFHFYEGTWYNSLNSDPLDTGFVSWQPGSQYQNDYGIGIPPNTTAYSINDLVVLIDNLGTSTLHSDYFDGSVEGVPDVYDQWVTGAYGPQPPFPSLITDNEEPWFGYVQTIPLEP